MKSLLKRFKKFLQLSPVGKWQVIRAFMVTGLISLALRLMSFQKFRSLYARMIKVRQGKDFPADRTSRLVESIRQVSPVFSALCLPQALALKYFMRHDKSAELIIGVKREGGFEAHAWVEKAGNILIGDLPEKDFKAIWKWN